ncbi:MAG TPA: PKD domain-containing protein, partial [Candidatus Acetothermia bacterium]|nr:PKD domain-containing protein [Candidatus Acetothermia bacterium]
VSFDGSGSSDPDGSIVSYAWEFGDGTTGTGVSPTHTYVSSGTYSVKLTVTDNQSATHSVTQTVNVAATPPVGWVSPVGHTGSGERWRNPERTYDYDAGNSHRSGSRHDGISDDQWTDELILHAPSGGIQSDRIRLLVSDSIPSQNLLAWVIDVHRDGDWVNVYTGTRGGFPEHTRFDGVTFPWAEVGFAEGFVTRVRIRAYIGEGLRGTFVNVYEVMLRDATVPTP